MMKKFLRILVWTTAVFLLLALVFRILGYNHLGLMLPNTVMEGRWGPSIDQYTIYENRRVKAEQPQAWPVSEHFNAVSLNAYEDSVHQAMQSVAFMVARKGEVIFERYWDDYSDTSHTNSWSMAKSIVNVLIGVALKDGSIKSLDDKATVYLPDFNLGELTIRHLLMMSSGMGFKESYKNPLGFAARALYGPDVAGLIQAYGPKRKPGEVFEYRSGNSQLLGLILEKATGKKLSDYATEKLWRRIGAEHDAYWSLDEKGVERSFCCFNSNVRDFSRIGELYRNKGIWKGDTIVTPEYVAMSTSFAPITEPDGSPNLRYGYHWWVANIDGVDMYYMRGVAGQYCLVIPSEELVITRLGHKRYEEPIKHHPWDWHQYLAMGRRIAALTPEKTPEVPVMLNDSLHVLEEVIMAP